MKINMKIVAIYG